MRGKPRAPALPSWLNPARFARLQNVLRDAGRLWVYTVGIGSTLLSLSVALRWFIVGLDTAALAEAARAAGFVALTVGSARGNRYVRLVFALALAASAGIGLIQVALALASGAVPYVVLLTEATMIPILYAGGALVLSRAPSVRAFTGTIRLPWPPRRSIVDHDL